MPTRESRALVNKNIIARIGNYRQSYGVNNFLRKLIFEGITIFNKINIRKLKSWLFFKSSNLRLGKNVIVNGLINSISIGKDNHYYENCIFHFHPNARFQTGDHVILSYHVLIACNYRISIGDHVMVGEYSSIRDSTHDYRADVPMINAQNIEREVVIGNNVWIGRGCLITEGTVIEDGVVLAANSVAKGRLLSNQIYGGCPARLIKSRV